MHWGTALLLLGSYITVWTISGSTTNEQVQSLSVMHRSFGVVILGLTAIRFAVRQCTRLPELPADVPWWQRIAARVNVAGLYALLFLQPLLGVVAGMLHGDTITLLGGFVLHAVLPRDRTLAHTVFEAHELVALLLLSQIGVHIAAALFHHPIRRDDVLARMLPGMRLLPRLGVLAASGAVALGRRDEVASPGAIARQAQPGIRGGIRGRCAAASDAAYNMARWLVGDATLAEDVVQDATVRALRYFGSYRGGDAKAWLLRIVRNTAHEARAGRRQHRADSLDQGGCDDDDAFAAPEVPDSADDPEAALARQERHATLDGALAALPIELRECLVLRELEELSYKEIAQITGVPVGTVMSRLWRARQNLVAAQLKGHC